MCIKRGFTLIELLAVIVILAIISLIAIPIILNIIESTKKEAFKESVRNLVDAIKIDATISEKELPFSYVVNDNEIFPKVSINGLFNIYGEVTINEKGKSEALIDNGTWCARKAYSSSNIILTPSPCQENPIIIGTLSVEPNWGNGLLVTSNATSSISKITNYKFTIKKQDEVVSTITSETNQYLFPFDILSNNENYTIEVVAEDNQGHTKTAETEYNFSYEPMISRYVIVELYENLDGNSLALNELEFLDNYNKTLSYTVEDVYDSTTNGKPFYWDSNIWSKEHLYDGKYSYLSNADGSETSTLFLFNSSTNVQKKSWARFLIDFGEEKEIKTINLWTGGTDRRQPYIIKMYSYSLDIDEKFSSTYIKNRDNSLPCIYERTFNLVYTLPTKNTNFFVHPKDTTAPIIKDIQVKKDMNILNVNTEAIDPYYSSGINQFRFALIKDNNKLTSNEITNWSEFQKTSTINYDLNSLDEGIYYIYTEVTDNASNTAFKVSSAYNLYKQSINNRYLIMEVYDHFGSNGAVITELEFYNDNQKISYDIPKIYDTATDGIPYYWNSTSYWQKSHLYDGKYSYTSNSSGGSTSTIFNYISVANQGTWSRAIIDFGNAKNINNLKIWLGGPEGRLPKEIHFYISDSKDIDTIYNQNIKKRDNTDLNEIAKFEFSENIKTVKMFQKTDLKIYEFSIDD